MKNKIEIFNPFALAIEKKIVHSNKIEHFGQNWTFQTKLDIPDKIGQFGQNWTIRTKLDNRIKVDNSDKIVHFRQTIDKN